MTHDPYREVFRTGPVGVPAASQCPLGHTPVEHPPGAWASWALRGWAGTWVRGVPRGAFGPAS